MIVGCVCLLLPRPSEMQRPPEMTTAVALGNTSRSALTTVTVSSVPTWEHICWRNREWYFRWVHKVSLCCVCCSVYRFVPSLHFYQQSPINAQKLTFRHFQFLLWISWMFLSITFALFWVSILSLTCFLNIWGALGKSLLSAFTAL